MGQFKVYGRRSEWIDRREALGDQLHAALVSAWEFPPQKRFQRFLWLDDDDMVAPQRGPGYLVVELVAFSGRSPAAKRALIGEVYVRVCGTFNLPVDDLELVILESPQMNWGIRGVSGEELTLGYTVEVTGPDGR